MVRKSLFTFVVLLFPFLAFSQLPVTQWVNTFGGSGDSKCTGMGSDAQNNVYVTGYFRGNVDFDPSVKVVNLISNGDADIYIAKYTPDGTLLWAKSAGGYGLDQVNSLAVDEQGNTTIIGQYQSPNFDADPGTGVNTINNAGGDDIFIIHLDKNGNFLWAKSMGGFDADRGEDVVTDKQGNVFTASIYQSTFMVDGKTLSASGQFNSLITKYDFSGKIVWSFSLGQGSYNEARGLGLDKNGNLVISGAATGVVDFNPLGVSKRVNSTGGYLAKYNLLGTLVWQKNIAVNLVSGGSEVCIDGNDNIYVGGAYSSAVGFENGTNLTANGYQDFFVAQFSTSGVFNWASTLGGSGGSIYGYRMAASSDNNVYITGYFNGTVDFNPDATVTNNLSDHGQRDLFVAKYAQNGSYVYAFNLGNSGCSSTLGIEVDVDGENNLLLAGSFCQSVNFSPSGCGSSPNTATNYNSDSFVAKYVQSISANPQIISFDVPRQVAPTIIDQVKHKITINLELGEDIASLVPVISVSGGVVSPASGTAHNFSLATTYTLTSGCTVVKYDVGINYIVTHTTTVIGTCSNVETTVPGDVLSFTPDSYLWQQQKELTWITALGTSVNQKDFLTKAYVNNGDNSITYNMRRQVIHSNTITYDSFYTINVLPSTSNNLISADITQYCATSNTPITFTGNEPQGFNSKVQYQWQQSTDNNNWQDITGAVQQGLKYTTPLTTTTYFRRITIKNSCTAYSNIIQIDYSTDVSKARAGNNQNLCNQVQTVLAANAPAVNEVGTWSVISPAGYNPFNENNIHNPAANITGIPNGNVILQWTIMKTTCLQQTADQVIITNASAPEITSFTINSQVSQAAIDQAAHVITVTVSPDADVSKLIPTIISNMGTVVPLSNSEQNFNSPVSYTITSGCGIITYKVIVNKASETQLTVCQRDVPVLQGAALTNVSTYQWQALQSAGWVNISNNSNQENYNAVYNGTLTVSTNTIQFRRMVVQSGVISYDSFYQVNYLPLISNNIINAARTTVCALDLSSIEFTGTAGNGGLGTVKNYQWQISTDNSTWKDISTAIGQNYFYAPALKQDVYIRRKLSSGSCEDFSTAIKILYVAEVTIANAGAQQILCNQPQTNLDANVPAADEVGTWSVLSPAGYNPFTSATLHDPHALVTNLPFNINVEFMWSISKAACGQVSQKTVIIHNSSAPIVSMGDDLVINPGEQVALKVQADGTNNTYVWSPAEGLNNPNILNPVASPLQTTNYTLKVTSAQGCITIGTVNVQVNNTLIIPNTFTPNGDGVNDYWNIKNLNQYISSQIWIYSRWGEQLYYSRGYAKPWDAIYKSKLLPAGVYYYLITVDELKLKKSGSITVIY